METVDIRQADVEDAEALTAVYRSAYQENRRLGFPAKAESVTPETVEEWIEADRVYVAEIEDELVGGVRLTKTDPERVKLSRLAVHEDWKGSGIGSGLVDHAESTVRTRGETTIWLTTPGEHPYLPGFYRSRGYEKTGNYPLEYRDYDEIVLEKQV
ncbi:GNAT family N-acetyltransferase [Halomicrococcus gelatinilyticus]|uniref:GNAT family N-acetyltransferase n=1 Tax=Halomicrococcus gelatinilyticus TaxID=1702103 RepID=UPI002E1308D0